MLQKFFSRFCLHLRGFTTAHELTFSLEGVGESKKINGRKEPRSCNIKAPHLAVAKRSRHSDVRRPIKQCNPGRGKTQRRADHQSRTSAKQGLIARKRDKS